VTEEKSKSKPEKTGIIEETLPNAMFRVRLDDGETVRVSIAPSARHSTVRLIAGCRVGVKLAANDPKRGLITRKL